MKKICILLTFALFTIGCEKSNEIFIDKPIMDKNPIAVVQPGDIEPILDPEPDPCPRHGRRKGKGHLKAKGKGHWKTKENGPFGSK